MRSIVWIVSSQIIASSVKMENKQEKAVIQTNISNSSINCVATKLCQILCVFVVKKGMFGFGNIGMFCKMDWIFFYNMYFLFQKLLSSTILVKRGPEVHWWTLSECPRS